MRVISITAWSVPGLLLVHHNILVFAAANRERLNLVLMASLFGIIALLQLVLVPIYGVTGAAVGTVLARFLGLALVALVCRTFAIQRGGYDMVPIAPSRKVHG